MLKTDRVPRWLAFHEAGHAVARLANDEVSAVHLPESEEEVRANMWLDVVEDLAGPIAEGRSQCWSMLWTRLVLGSGGDFEDARERLALLGREGDLEAAWKESWKLVRVHWPAIQALAAALLRANELDGEAVEEIVGRAMPDRFPGLLRRPPTMKGSGNSSDDHK